MFLLNQSRRPGKILVPEAGSAQDRSRTPVAETDVPGHPQNDRDPCSKEGDAQRRAGCDATLSELFQFDSDSLVIAIQRTFERRKTALPVDEPPIALTEEFYANATKTAQWNAFSSKNRFYIQPSSLESVMTSIREFLMPLMQSEIMSGEHRLRWEPSGSWIAV
jgi:hypothetical protein